MKKNLSTLLMLFVMLVSLNSVAQTNSNACYQNLLEPIRNYSENPTTYQDWGFSSQSVFDELNGSVELELIKKKLGEIKSRLKYEDKIEETEKAIFYYELLADWERYKQRLKASESYKKPKNDSDIMRNVMNRYKGNL